MLIQAAGASGESSSEAAFAANSPHWAATLAGLAWRHATIGWLCLYIPTIVLFYWKILLTGQFSLLTEGEHVNQAYSWLRFWVSSVRRLELPVWDPYSFAGHSFCGEMQTAAFYPPHLFLAFFPLNHAGVLSPHLYHYWWASVHIFAACFFFLLLREFALGYLACFVGGICFALGGFVGQATWPHMLESSIWLPAIFLFLLKGLRARDLRESFRSASIGGLALGMSILAGGFHLVVLQGLAIVSATVFYAASKSTESPGRRWVKSAAVALTIVGVGSATGAVQLWPSMEYSQRALRWLGKAGAFPANQKIPYEYMNDELAPQGIVSFLFRNAFNGNNGDGEVPNPNIGVFPLFAAIIGIRRNWQNQWVRYLTGLAIAAVLYSFGSFSWLNGVLYAVIPKLWMAREASRMVYLADFSLAILAAFGIETLVREGRQALWPNLNRTLTGLVIVCGACLLASGLFAKPEMNPWISFSFVLIFASYALINYLAQHKCTGGAKFLIVALVLFDLGAFDWTARGLISAAGTNQLNRNLSLQGAVHFLRSRPGPFRVQIDGAPQANIGDMFGIASVSGAGVTLPSDFLRIIANRDLLNVRYLIRPASATDRGAVYQDSSWKVYENASALPRAWLVHEYVVDKSSKAPAFDPRRTALVDRTLPESVEPLRGAETAEVSDLRNDRLRVEVHARSRGLLVLSETYYPGWRASVNGVATEIHQVDGDLRGIVVPAGASVIVFRYAPVSFYAGASISLLTVTGLLLFFLKNKRARTGARNTIK